MKKRSLSSIVASAALAIGLGGCASNLAGTPEQNAELRRRNEGILERYFTPSAASLLNVIPVHYALLDSHFATAASSHSMLDAMWNGWGYEPITVYNLSGIGKISDSVMVHENVHHAERLEAIDRDEFMRAWDEMKESEMGDYIAKRVNTEISQRYGFIDEDTFITERIGWMGQYIVNPPTDWGVRLEVPVCMRTVYRHALSADVLKLNSNQK